ncbi:RNB domain-containing ribonuclease [Synechococcus sp. CBW1002]|nr:RNB domain-containing ribonuclease [Synechococcus sp. CBW1002]
MPLASQTLQPGDLVGLSTDKGPQLALVRGLQSGKAKVLAGFLARPQQLPLRQITLLIPLPSGADIPAGLGASPWNLSAEVVAEALPSRRQLGEAWHLLVEDGQPQPLSDFASLLGDGANPALLAACWLWLEGDQLLFRWRHGVVEPRPVDELRRLRRDRRRERLVLERRRRWHEALRRRQPLDPTTLDPEHRRDLELLMLWAGGDSTDPLPLELRQALQVAHCPAETGAIRHLMVDLGLWQPHHLPSLARSHWQHGFSDELLTEAEELVAQADQPQPGDEQRRDLTGLRMVTIDDADTRDIDDGLSLETLPGGVQRLWIHVADPGRLVPAGSALDLEARRRASSLYLAGGTLPMFPECLSTGPFSLVQGRRCAAWSLWVELDATGAVADFGLQRSWVQPTYRLSYADADELIELAPPQEADLLCLHQLLLRRRGWRQQHGALMMDQPEGRIRAAGDEPVLEIVEPGPSRLLVAEAMILAGAVVAEFGRREGLALPYRSQLPTELPSPAELEALPPGPVRHAAIKRCLSRSHTGTQPALHFSLALEGYAQATSPIRRYGDLLVQRQLQAALTDQAPLPEEDVAALLSELEDPVKQGIQISREDHRHWQQVWFAAHQRDQWPGVFLRWLRPQERLALVHVEDLAMDLVAECPEGSDPGDALLLRVLEVDPLRDQLRLQGRASVGQA